MSREIGWATAIVGGALIGYTATFINAVNHINATADRIGLPSRRRLTIDSKVFLLLVIGIVLVLFALYLIKKDE